MHQLAVTLLTIALLAYGYAVVPRRQGRRRGALSSMDRLQVVLLWLGGLSLSLFAAAALGAPAGLGLVLTVAMLAGVGVSALGGHMPERITLLARAAGALGITCLSAMLLA